METKKSPCVCRAVLAILVIVFAWLPGDWTKIALTILGALLAIAALIGTCCCASMCQKQEASSQSE
jgi:hypothetical protein